MINLRIGGVPEHFNLPWSLAADAGRFSTLGAAVAWRDYAGGSGAMAKALRAGELDAALLLTEGAVAGIAEGGGYRISSLYTETPLIWGIHVPAASALCSVADVRGARYAISRRGSGSHLMAYVHARAEGWPVDSLQFVVVDNLDGAVAAFASGTADVFFWEKFMTKPLVDTGVFRRVGEFSAPWPAFVMCVAERVDAAQRAMLDGVLAAVLEEAHALQARDGAAAVIAERYGIAVADVVEWLGKTRWSSRVGIGAADLAAPCNALAELGVLARRLEPADCLAP
jgi:ABC-type nitrate/sulfonate/bicarbonate transport system substrate-binding protein